MLVVLIGSLLAALGAGALLLTLRYNLQASRAERLQLQADVLADSGIEDTIAYLRNNNGQPPASTTEWTVTTTANNFNPVSAVLITATDNIFSRAEIASYYSVDIANYGVLIQPYPDGTDTLYDIYGFGIVGKGSDSSLSQKYKKVLKSSSNGVVNFFVLASESRPFLTVTHP